MSQKQKKRMAGQAGSELQVALKLIEKRQWEAAQPHANKAIKLMTNLWQTSVDGQGLMLFAILAQAECLLWSKPSKVKDGLASIKTARRIADQIGGAAKHVDAASWELEMLLKLPAPWPAAAQEVADESWRRLLAMDGETAHQLMSFYAEQVFWIVPRSQALEERLAWAKSKVEPAAFQEAVMAGFDRRTTR